MKPSVSNPIGGGGGGGGGRGGGPSAQKLFKSISTGKMDVVRRCLTEAPTLKDAKLKDVLASSPGVELFALFQKHNGGSPLSCAVITGSLEMVQLLLEFRADGDELDPRCFSHAARNHDQVCSCWSTVAPFFR